MTGTFRHSAGNVVDLSIAGEPAAIGVTANHSFWSVDRKRFVAAGELRVGERTLCANGKTRHVLAVTTRSSQSVVFNLEVDAQHVYCVGEQGLLVHND